MEDVIAEIQNDLAKLFINEESDPARGLYMMPQNTLSVAGFMNGARWINGLVRYRFINEDEVYTEDRKKVARDAMAQWQTETNSRVRFEEITPSTWEQISKGIGQFQYVTFKLVQNSNDSSVGSNAGSRIRISPSSANDKPTYLHEIGHTLGLMHEHQRHDRDSYVTIDSKYLNDNISYGIIPKQNLVAGLQPVRIFCVTVYLPYVWYIDYGKTVGEFDFNSIMIYSSFAGVNRKTHINGSNTIYYTKTLSEIDIKTILEMY